MSIHSPADPAIRRMLTTSDHVLLERARLETALSRIYATTRSFDAVVSAVQSALQSLGARVRADGDDTGGWVA